MAYYFPDMAKKTDRSFFGDRLRTLRREKGLTQADLGKRVGLSRRMIVHYEKHATRPPVDKVLALSKTLGLNVDELVKDNGKIMEKTFDPKFARKLEKAKTLPPSDQTVLSGIIDSFLQKNGTKRKRTAATTAD